MKAMILAAGKGTRMHPLTLTQHKGLLEVGGETLIERHIKNLARIGVREIIINVSYLATQIQEYLGDGKNFGVEIIYSVEAEPLEVGGGMINALPLLGKEPFISISCDIWTDYPLQALLNTHLNTLAHLVLVKNPDYHIHGDFSLENGFITLSRSHTYTYANIGLIDPALFHDYKTQKQALRPILEEAISANGISGELYHGQWFNVGTPETLAQVRACIR